ncbi:hypothetical protein AAFF_G00352780 [Aldrovandia affinis]|uniref:Uncharacterized protein n=1 Tax=Aldrovandia affinis TaxID=143900 RepID=A0AAD7SL88_9TELE|nr:hypothetical protein AAFF_G00352780 [Aldrovandia affinis]
MYRRRLSRRMRPGDAPVTVPRASSRSLPFSQHKEHTLGKGSGGLIAPQPVSRAGIECPSPSFHLSPVTSPLLAILFQAASPRARKGTADRAEMMARALPGTPLSVSPPSFLASHFWDN